MQFEDLLRAGNDLYDCGDRAAAAARYQEALDLDPRSAQPIIQLGIIALDEGRFVFLFLSYSLESLHVTLLTNPKLRFAEAAELFNHVDARQQNEVLLYIGIALYSLGNPEGAFERLQEALVYDPDNAFIHSVSADCQLAFGDLETAGRSVNTALKLDPKCPQAHNTAARIAMSRGETDDAVAALTEALLRGGSAAQDGLIRCSRSLDLGLSELDRGNDAGAVTALRDALASGPPIALGHHSLGVALSNLGRGAEAICEFESSIRLCRTSPWSLRAAGSVHLESGETGRAVECFRGAVAIDPNSADAQV